MTMHRLQISVPDWQANFLAARARRDGVSIAETVRRLVEREAEMEPAQQPPEAFLHLAGTLHDTQPLIDGVPVSEDPDLYLVARELQAMEDPTTETGQS